MRLQAAGLDRVWESRIWDERRLSCLWAMGSTDRGRDGAGTVGWRAPGPLLLEAKLPVWGLSSFGGSLLARGDMGTRGHPSRLDGDGDKEEEAVSGLFLSQAFQNTGTNISYIPQ